MLDGHWRAPVARVTDPVGAGLARLGVTANALTVVGLLAALGSAVAIATNRLFMGAVIMGVSALPDLFDGPVAKAAGTASTRGAFFDSVADRVSDALILGGLAWFLESSRGGHYAMLAFALMGASVLVSYQRAKAESLGYQASGGLMERAERLVALAVGLVFSNVLIPVLWATLILTAATAAQRFVKVWRQGPTAAPAPGTVPAREPAAWRPGRVESRWRVWREEALARTERVWSEGPTATPYRPRRTGAPADRWRARRHGSLTGRSTRSTRVSRAAARPPGGPRERAAGAWRRRIDSDT